MAAVAGTIAEFVCRRLIKENAQIAVVENIQQCDVQI